MRAAWLSLTLALGACSPTIPTGTYVCTSSAQCPPGQVCFSGLCVREAGDAGRSDAAPCTPTTDCDALRAQCGSIGDGCGGSVDCGTCAQPFDTCGLQIANICDCEPSGCAPGQCGAVDNGCGGLVECGGCDAGLNCVSGTCVCAPETCDGRCGTIPDGCGETLVCEVCGGGETCGGAGPNRCGTGPCTPTTCALEGKNCGEIADGCGGTLSCGTCGDDLTCGGGTPGVANVCGCTPQTCGDLDRRACGTLTEICGTTLDCGGCGTLGETCGGGGTPNLCGCAPDSSEPNETTTAATAKGTLFVGGDSVTLDDQTLHDAGDTDWFEFEVAYPSMAGDEVAISFGATLDSRLLGNQFVSLTVECEGGVGSVSCLVGAPLGTFGCTSERFGALRSDVVALQTVCRVTRVLVNVGQTRVGTTWTCPPYELVVGAT